MLVAANKFDKQPAKEKYLQIGNFTISNSNKFELKLEKQPAEGEKLIACSSKFFFFFR